jgi:hypothetical protein
MTSCTQIRVLLAVVLFAVVAGVSDAQPAYKRFFPDEADPFMGDYEGRWSEQIDVDPEIHALVFPLGQDTYQIRIVAKRFLRATPKAIIEAKAEDGKIEFDEQGHRGVIQDGKIVGGQAVGDATFEMTRVVHESPTLGKEPPEGAIVLFDGSNLEAWDGTAHWEIVDGILMVTPMGKYLESKQTFKDVELHVEFRTPLMERSRGQQRGNSGVFVQDVYEVQVLDSYGLEGYYDECGALYKLSAPRVNACAPPLQWQTYDIEYTAAKYNANGELEANGRMTVYHNGVLIQDDVELKWRTDWKEQDRLKPPPTEPGPIKLQGHNNYVQFRNIWVVDKSK